MTADLQTTDEPCLIAAGLSKRFGSFTAVDRLDLKVDRGQTFGFLGPNGAGKSTTIRMMLGLVSPSAGVVTLLGRDVALERTKALKRVGAMVEIPAFYSYLTGRQNVRLFARLSGGASEDDVTQALKLVGILHRADSKVRTYSHGMKQRLGIASALAPRPDLVILDEPTNGLDPEGVREVRDLIRDLGTRHGMTVFLSSHLLHEVEQVCSHVAVIANGRLMVQGAVSQLLGNHFGPVEFEVDRPEEAAALIQATMGLAPHWTDDTRVAIHMDRAQAAEANAILVGKGFKVSAIERRKQTLEDVYLQLVRDQAEVEAAELQ